MDVPGPVAQSPLDHVPGLRVYRGLVRGQQVTREDIARHEAALARHEEVLARHEAALARQETSHQTVAESLAAFRVGLAALEARIRDLPDHRPSLAALSAEHEADAEALRGLETEVRRIQAGTDKHLIQLTAESQANQALGLEARADARAVVEACLPLATGRRNRNAVAGAPGITLIGDMHGTLGLGEAARRIASAIRAAGIPLQELSYDARTRKRGSTDAPKFNVRLFALNPDALAWLCRDAPDWVDGGHRIGYFWWETSHLPVHLMPALTVVDEVWVGSEHVSHVFRQATWKPVHILPPALSTGPRPSSAARRGTFRFLFTFDANSTAERKNPQGLLAAYRAAFEKPGATELVIKAMNTEHRPQLVADLSAAAAGRPDISFIHERLGPEALDRLYAECDAYVSLHRAEGLGLTLSDAMAHGKPVIATGATGNLEFMDSSNSILVPCVPSIVPEDCPPYEAGSSWFEPDLAAAAAAMRRLASDPAAAKALGERGRESLAQRHGQKVAADRIRARFDALQHALRGPA